MSTARSPLDITANIDCAELDKPLFDLLHEAPARDALSDAITTFWLDRGLQDLRAVVTVSGQVSQYERGLRDGSVLLAGEPTAPAYVRSPAFRRVVTEAYDYRCAATGLRVVLPNGDAMVQAAHIHPFAVAADDDPRNGLALSPDMHWAMDKHLIAPGPDMKWHVSTLLDERIPDLSLLMNLAGKPLLLPSELRFSPKREGLEWRLENLRSSD